MEQALSGTTYTHAIPTADFFAKTSPKTKRRCLRPAEKPSVRTVPQSVLELYQPSPVFTVTSIQKKPEITLVLNLSGDQPASQELNTIYLNDLEALRNYKALLGDKCEIKVHSGQEVPSNFFALDELLVMPALKKENLAEVSSSVNKTLKILHPHYEWLTSSPLALASKDTLPPAISRLLVHKKRDENVLISQPHKTGNLYWFNMFETSAEFNFDHESDHVQGMLLMEGLRQASIASVHEAGLPIDGSLALLSFDIGFSSYVDHGYPILIRTFPYFKAQPDGKEALALVISQVFQKGRLCAEASVSGQAFFSAEEYKMVRERTKTIIDRQEKKFEQKLACATV